jgi:hypothetical protein
LQSARKATALQTDLRGNFDNHAVAIELRKVDISKFRLVSEKFRWSFQY